MENAALQHQRKAQKAAEAASSPAAVLSMGSKDRGAEYATYTRGGELSLGAGFGGSAPGDGRVGGDGRAQRAASPGGIEAPQVESSYGGPLGTGNIDTSGVDTGGSGPGALLVVGDGSRVHINSRGSDTGGSLVVGDDASVHINSRGSGTGGSLVVGDDANVHINSRGSGTGGSLVIGDGSRVHINSRGSDTGGSLVIGDDASVHINSRDSAAASVNVPDRSQLHRVDRAADSAATLAAPPPASAELSSPLSADRSQARVRRLALDDTGPRAHAPPRAEPASRAAPSQLDPGLNLLKALVEHALAPERFALQERAKDDGAASATSEQAQQRQDDRVAKEPEHGATRAASGEPARAKDHAGGHGHAAQATNGPDDAARTRRLELPSVAAAAAQQATGSIAGRFVGRVSQPSF